MFTYLEIFSGVLIAIINSNCSTANSNIEADIEISWFERHAGAILLDNQLSIEEMPLGSSRVDHLWLGDHHRSVF
jgi:hypothetical protein